MASLCRRLVSLAPVFNRVLNTKSTQIVSSSSVLVNQKHWAQIHRKFSSTKPMTKKETVTLAFVVRGERTSTQAKVGDNLLDIIVENDIDIDGFGACEGTLACSTCHLIFKQADYEKIPEQPTDEELDMLDLAYSLTDTSRLGCQVIVTKEMDGWEVVVPAGVADARGS